MVSSIAVVLLGLASTASAELAHCGEKETADEVAALVELSGRVVIVTGGDSGLGFATATAVARRGATVIIATHNLLKGQKAAQEIVNATHGVAHGYALDLSSFASVRAFAQKFEKDFHGKLDILFNNAGVMGLGKPDLLTKDGFEIVFQVNYLGPFLLTELLLPALRRSRGRIVNTASSASELACNFAGLPQNCLKDWTNIPPQPVSGNLPWYKGKLPKMLYGLSKLLSIVHAQELAVREAGNGVTAFSLCPGFASTAMTMKGPWWVQELTKDLFCGVVKASFHKAVCPYTAEQGAAVLAYVGLQAPAEDSGAWYTRWSGCGAQNVTMNGFTTAMRPELYDKSLAWVGFKSSDSSHIIV